MKTLLSRPLLAAALAVTFLPAAARAQTPAPSTREPARAPIPPGVPTTADNCHLPTEGEIRLGREGSTEVEKVYKVIAAGPYHDRLQRVARDVVASFSRQEIINDYKRVYRLPRKEDKSRRVPFEFTFKVVDTKEVNAFSLAGGPIYVTTALMDYAPTDHELAAVLAHECAHVAYHHVQQLIQKQRKINSQGIWALLATVLAGVAGGGAVAGAAGNVLMASQLVSIATLTGYGRDLEHEADRVGVMALIGTDYNPTGMLTFMQKLARDDRLRGNPDGGIYQSHPYSNERASTLRKQLTALGYRLDNGSLRQVSGTFRVEAIPRRINGRDGAELRLNGNLLYLVAAGEGDLKPLERAQKIASQIELLFGDNVTFNDVRLGPDKMSLWVKGVPVIQVYSEDAAAAGDPVAAADRAYKEIVRALWQEKLRSPD